MARDPETSRRRLLAGCAGAGAALLAGCSASGEDSTETDNDGATMVPATEVTVEFGGEGRVDLGAVESSEGETVDITVVDTEGNTVTVDGLTVTVSAGSATLEDDIVRQVTGESVAVTFDGSHGLDLDDGQSEGTLAVGIVAPPRGNYVDEEPNPELVVEA